MPAVIQTELTLPANERLMRLAQDYVRNLAELAGLTAEEAEALAQAVWEACHNAIEHAYDEDDGGNLRLAGELTPATLILAVHDQGLPFCRLQDEVEAPSGPEDPAPACFPGRSLYLRHTCADEVRWINHGIDGNELRLTKYLAGVCRLETPPAAGAPQPRPVAGPKGSPHYTIRLLRPGDARRVAQLMYRVYGYSYSNEDFYYPDRLDHDLETGRHVGVVAVADDGEIVGHLGVERSDPGHLAELGQMAVAPAHRGHDLHKLMGDLLQAEIQRLGLIGLFGEAVTLHTISQEASERRGLHVAGLKLLDWQARFKKLQTIPGADREASPTPLEVHRESMVFYFKYLTPPERTLICAPTRHRQILAKIYGNLAVPVEFLPPSGPTGRGKLLVHYDQATGAGVIQVNRIGLDTLPEIYQARRDLSQIVGAPVIGLLLPLAQGGTPYLCEAAEADGFFFSGVQPNFAPDGDFLRLQYLNADLDPDRLQLFSPFARELLAYVLDDRARVKKPH